MYIKLGHEKSPIDLPYNTFEYVIISIECFDGSYNIPTLIHLLWFTVEIWRGRGEQSYKLHMMWAFIPSSKKQTLNSINIYMHPTQQNITKTMVEENSMFNF
jgi:hypothetical protein